MFGNIPMQPDNESDFEDARISKTDREVLVYHVLYECPEREAYALFHGEYDINATRKLNTEGRKRCKQLFDYARAKEYMDAYKATLKKWLESVSDRNIREVTSEDYDVSDESRDEMLKKFMHDITRAVRQNKTLDPEVLKDFSGLLKNVGLLKDAEEKVEAPRRYLPEKCYNSCRYRIFVESHVATGEIVDECRYCNALAFAKERGFVYDPTKLLDLPSKTTPQ